MIKNMGQDVTGILASIYNKIWKLKQLLKDIFKQIVSINCCNRCYQNNLRVCLERVGAYIITHLSLVFR